MTGYAGVLVTEGCIQTRLEGTTSIKGNIYLVRVVKKSMACGHQTSG